MTQARPRIEPEDLCEPEWVEWYRLTPGERWMASARLWADYLSLGGTLDPEPDTQSPFHDALAPRAVPARGNLGTFEGTAPLGLTVTP